MSNKGPNNRALNYLRNKLIDKVLYDYPHYVGLSSNLHDKDIFPLEDENISTCDPIYIRQFPFNCTFPLPLLPVKNIPKSSLYGVDPGLEIVLKKSRWKTMIKREVKDFLMSSRFKDIKVIKTELNKNSHDVQLPQYIVLLAKIIEMDPDDQFDGWYNWYYSGGCLNQINLQENRILLRSSGKAFNSLEAVPFIKHKSKKIYTKLNNKKSVCFKINKEQPIFQIAVNEENGHLAVRQRCKCFIFSLTKESNSLKLTKIKTITSMYPFTSIDFDKNYEGKCITMNTQSQVFLRDINRNRSIIQKMSVPDCSNEYVDKWCSAMYGQNNDMIICSNRRFIRTYDPRARNMNCMEFCEGHFSDLVENCEEITCVVEGSRKCSHPLIYVTTQHQLLAMDLRFPRAFVQRWSHGMTHSPSYICTTVVNDATSQNQQEVIFLRSQISNELHAIVNTFGGTISFDMPFSDVFPFSLPSYCDTLRLAQWHGRILNPMLQKRLSNITVGMCCFEERKGHIVCMSQNSVGDLFQQHLVPKNGNASVETKDVISYVAKWEEGRAHCKTPQKKLQVTVRTDMKNLFKKVLNNSDDIQPIKDYCNSNNWKISKNKLMRHNDMLAHKILEPWEIEKEWEDDDDPEPVLPSTQEPVDKVSQWLGACNIFSSTPIAVPASPKNIQDSNAAQFLSSRFCESVTNSPESNRKAGGTKRKVTTVSASQPKKKRFVDGF